MMEGWPERRHRDIRISATTPNSLAARINHERMPVLLTREDEFEIWLHGTPKEAFALARAYPPERMRIVQEGFGKEDGAKFETIPEVAWAPLRNGVLCCADQILAVDRPVRDEECAGTRVKERAR